MDISLKKLFCIHILIWILVELSVNPIGNFPLNDDWAYSQNVYFLVAEGRFDFSDWMAMTLILQVFWGTLVCKIFGFSFTVLRLSTVFLAVVASWTGFVIFKQYTRKTIVAYAAALLLMLNPMYFSLANSFMTEIPFLSVFLPALYFFSRYLDETESNGSAIKFWWGGVVFSLLATMIRQPALLLPLAFVPVYLWRQRKQLQIKEVAIAVFPFVFSFAAYKGYSYWLESTQDLPAVYGEISLLFNPFLDGSLFTKLTSRNNEMLFYCGWFLMPMTIYLWRYYWTESTLKQKVVAAVITILIASPFVWMFDLFPMGNMFYNFGLGPKLLHGIQTQGHSQGFSLEDFSWLMIKGVGIAGGLLMSFELLLAAFIHLAQKRGSILLCFVLFLGYYAFFILNPYYIDRYILIVIPLFIIFLLPPTAYNFSTTWLRSISIIPFVLLVWFGISATRDYLSWNRLSWNIARGLEVERGVSPTKILGGFEYTNWYLRPEVLPKITKPSTDTSKYAISFDPFICGWVLEESHPFPQWMLPGTGHVYLHKEKKASFYKDIFCDSEQLGNAKGDLLTSDTNILLENRAVLDTTVALSGKQSIRLDENHRYSFGYKIKVPSPCHLIRATVWRKRKPIDIAEGKKSPSVLVFKTEDLHYHDTKVVLAQNAIGWEQLSCRMELYDFPDDQEISVFLWNNSGETQWFDDFRLTVIVE